MPQSGQAIRRTCLVQNASESNAWSNDSNVKSSAARSGLNGTVLGLLPVLIVPPPALLERRCHVALAVAVARSNQIGPTKAPPERLSCAVSGEDRQIIAHHR